MQLPLVSQHNPQVTENFVPEPLNEKPSRALDEIKTTSNEILQGWIRTLQASMPMDGPSIIDNFVTRQLAYLATLDEKTTRLFTQTMATIYPIVKQHPLYVMINPILTAKTGDEDIQKKILDGVAAPLINNLAESFNNQSILDTIIDTVPQNI